MATQIEDRTEGRPLEAPELESLRPDKLLSIVALIALVVGGFSALGGIVGAVYTYQQAAVEQIVTPDDAMIASADVRGPLTMWAQADIITQHQLDRTEGLRYAEMPREVQQVDEAGQPMVDEAGDPVMGPNQDRLSWIDATALTSVLNLGIMAYALSAFAVAIGVTISLLGLALLRLRNRVTIV
jgi:hypothetical protein